MFPASRNSGAGQYYFPTYNHDTVPLNGIVGFIRRIYLAQ